MTLGYITKYNINVVERVHLQLGAMDAYKVHELRVPVVVARVRMVHCAVVHAVHPWVHGVSMARYPRHQDGGLYIWNFHGELMRPKGNLNIHFIFLM